MLKIKAVVSKLLFVLFIIGIFLISMFLLQNSSNSDVSFLFFDNIQIPTIILIIVSATVGFVGGYLLPKEH